MSLNPYRRRNPYDPYDPNAPEEDIYGPALGAGAALPTPPPTGPMPQVQDPMADANAALYGPGKIAAPPPPSVYEPVPTQ